jgi:hypothetical protein
MPDAGKMGAGMSLSARVLLALDLLAALVVVGFLVLHS